MLMVKTAPKEKAPSPVTGFRSFFCVKDLKSSEKKRHDQPKAVLGH